MERRHIEMLFAIRKFGNMTKAADCIGITQPTLSKFLSNCENKLKIELFYRRSRSMEPTEEGLVVLESLDRIRREYEAMELKLKEIRSGSQINLSLATHQVLGKFFIPKLEVALKNNKNINLSYIFMNSRQATEKVINGEIDLAIVADPQKYPELIIYPLWKEYIGLYSKDGKLKETILYNSNMIFFNKVMSKIKYRETKKIDDYNIIYSILKRSSNMGLLPNPIAESEQKLKLIKKLQPSIDICLIYDSKRKKNKSFVKAIKVIRACSAKWTAPP